MSNINTDGELIEAPRSDIMVARDPNAVLAEAKKAAEALMSVVKLKKSPVIFNKEQYLEFEDWQTVGKFYGITAKVTETRFVDYGGVHGFESGADAIGPDGRVLSHADSMCLNDEENWSTRAKYEWTENNGKKQKNKIGDVPVPLFQLRSMAQTRACAKVLRNVLAWVVVLAGFKPSVAEEMTGDETPSSASEPQKPKMDVSALQGQVFKDMKAKFPSDCKACGKKIEVGSDIKYSAQLKSAFHPACLIPKKEEAPVQDSGTAPSKGILLNLQKMATAAGVKLIDRIGKDGHDNINDLPLVYVNDLLAEFAEIIDQQSADAQ